MLAALRILFGSALLSGVASGCNQPVSTSSTPPMGPKPAAAPDGSLTTAKYVQAGVPDPGRPWTTEDMTAAAKALAALAEKSPQALPRYQSERSGAVFARITAADNLKPFRDRSRTLERRFLPAADFLQASNDILKLYLVRFVRKEVADSDMVELMGMQFRGTVLLLELIEEFLPTLNKEDPNYLTRMGGLERTRQGLIGLATAGFVTLTERHAYRPAELQRLIGFMQETYPAIFAGLPREPRDDLMGRLDTLVKDPKLADLQPDLRKLQTQLQAVAANPAQGQGELPGLKREDLEKMGMTMHRVQAGEPDATGWCVAQPTGVTFSVRLPGRFNDFTHTSKAKDGVAITMHVVGMKTLVGTSFSAMALTRPDGKFKSRPLDDIVAGFRKDGQRVERQDVQIAGHAGVEFKVTGPKSAAFFRVFQTHDTLYQMIVEYPTFLPAEPIARDAKQFFESFTLNKETK